MASPAKTSPSATATLARALSRFLAWWRGELLTWVPVGLRRWWRESDRIVLFSLDGGRGILERIDGDRRQQILAVDLAGDATTQRMEVGRQLPRLAGSSVRLLLAVPPTKVLRRTLVLPLAVEENLRQTLTFELDRYTPFRPDHVYFDFRVLGRDTQRRRLTVELATVQRTVVDHDAARATALGLPVHGAVLADDVAHNAGYLDFLPATAGTHKPSSRLWRRVALGSLATLLLAALLAAPIVQKRAAAIALLGPLDRAKSAAMETDALRERMTKAAEQHNFLLDLKWASPSTVLVLEELSKLLPDDTFVMQLDFDGKTVQIQGESASSAGLVELLEASPMFKDVGFKAQLTKIQGTPSDRFHIAATLEPDARPKPPVVPAAAPAALPAPVPAPPAAVTPEANPRGEPPGAAATAAAPAPAETKP